MAGVNAVIVLLAGLSCLAGFYVEGIIEPPACDKVPDHGLCLKGLFSQCAHDLGCPSFTRCCWDGCFKRCTDTTTESAAVARTKRGECPRVLMVFPCTAKADYCLDDSHCLGDEKCCMGRDCGKRCMLPEQLAAVKKATRAFSCAYVTMDSWACPVHVAHYCAVDSECPLESKCCFDGCHRRCTDRLGRLVHNTPGKSCPFLRVPVSCDRPSKKCYDDRDCGQSTKCCSDTCNSKCVASEPLVGVVLKAQAYPITEPTIPVLDKPGKCPVLERPKDCNPGAYECNYDVDCWDDDKKCCDNGCTTICVKPAGFVDAIATTQPVTTKMRETTMKMRPTTMEPTTMVPTTEMPTTMKTTMKRTTMAPTTEMPTTMKAIMKRTTMAPTTEMPTTMKTTTKRTTMAPTTEMPMTTEMMMKSTMGSTSMPTTTEEIITIAVTLPPKMKDGIWIFPDRFTADAGKIAGAVCVVRGEPFEGWYNPQGVKITSTDPKDNVYVAKRGDDFFLMVKKAGVAHGGKYVCRGAFLDAVFDLKIKVAVDESKSSQYLRPGEVGLIQVSIRGFPLPKYKWIKDNKPINFRSGRYAVGKMGCFLAIKKVRRSDKGMYSLMVDDEHEADINVNVVKDKNNQASCPIVAPPDNCKSIKDTCYTDEDCFGKMKCCSDSCNRQCNSPEQDNHRPPEVKTYRPDAGDSLTTGERIRRVCLVYKQPFVGWYAPNEQQVTSVSRDERVHVEKHGIYQVLVINNVTVEDAGKYICQGALHNASIEIKVDMHIGKFRDAVMLKPGATGLIPLSIRSYPAANFVWYKRGRPLDMDSDRYSVSPSGSLGIRRVRSADVGIYTLKNKMQGDEVHNVGVSIAVAVEGVDFTAWQETFASGATVRCLKEEMYIELEKKVLAGYSVEDLSLKDSSCRAESNGTHYSFRAPLVGCGTDSKFTKESVVYSNVVKEFRSKDNMITRVQDVNIPFSCFYTSEGVTSTFGLLPMKVRKVMDGGNATTNFVLGMELYRDKSFTTAYASVDFPLRVTVNRPLFVQVSIDSPDKRLNVFADRCYATPTQNPNHVIQYDIVRDGCKVDPTVISYPGPAETQRFSFKAFKFISEGQQFVYLHCHLIVCNASDPNTRCAQGCESVSRRHRRAINDDTAKVELTQGPFILDQRSPQTLTQQKESSSWSIYIWVVSGMAGFCLICLIAMMYMRKQIARQRNKPIADPDRETNV